MTTQRPIELNDYLSQGKAAEALGITVMTLWRWMKDDKIRPIIVGGHRMIPRSEVDRLKAEKEEAAE